MSTVSSSNNADLILHGGKIYTSDDARPWAEAVVIRDGKFIHVGNTEEAEMYKGPDVPCHDLEGKFVLPGIIDSHTHLGLSVVLGGDDEIPDLTGTTKEEVLSNLRTYVKQNPFRLYYTGFFGEMGMFGPEGPHKEDLDSVVRRRPVFLLDSEGHSLWVNSGALKLLKVTKDTPDIVPGLSCYTRDESGEPLGCIKEMAVIDILGKTMKTSKKELKAGMLRIMDYFVRHGVTAIFDAGMVVEEEKAYAILAEMDRAGELPLRVEATHMVVLPKMVPNCIEEFKRLRRTYAGNRLRFNTLKILLDGTSKIRTAKQIEPYSDLPGCTGGTLLSENELYELLLKLHEESIDLHLHTVGSGAIRLVLNALERALEEVGKLNSRVTVAHVETLRDSDIPRFRKMGVIANFTPHWHGGCLGDRDHLERVLGKDRARNQLRARGIIEDGGLVTFSSDEISLHDLCRFSPFVGMEIGHTRQEIKDGGKDAEVYPPESERLDLKDLVKGYTINGAIQLRLDNRIGSIEVGKDADLVVLGKNLFEIDPYEIHTIEPELVMIEGSVAWGGTPE